MENMEYFELIIWIAISMLVLLCSIQYILLTFGKKAGKIGNYIIKAGIPILILVILLCLIPVQITVSIFIIVVIGIITYYKNKKKE